MLVIVIMKYTEKMPKLFGNYLSEKLLAMITFQRQSKSMTK